MGVVVVVVVVGGGSGDGKVGRTGEEWEKEPTYVKILGFGPIKINVVFSEKHQRTHTYTCICSHSPTYTEALSLSFYLPMTAKVFAGLCSTISLFT